MTLKTRNMFLITSFVLLNIIGFAFVNNLPWDFLRKIEVSKNSITFQNPLVSLLFPIIVLIVSYYLPESVKNIVVLWKVKNPLPGCRIFTELSQKDPRIDVEELVRKYGSLPEDPIEQNRLWYKIYKEKQDEAIIRSSHGIWLLFRDMAAIALLFFLTLSPMTFIIAFNKISTLYSITLFIQYIILSINGQNTAERFACNVLAR